jgi:hypothetical protein
MHIAQSRQSAKLFLQSSQLGPPPKPPHPQVSMYPPLLVPGRGPPSLGGEGVGGPKKFGRGDRHCGPLVILYIVKYICIYLEYYSVCPSSELGPTFSRERKVCPHPETKGGGGGRYTLALGWGSGTIGEKAYYFF